MKTYGKIPHWNNQPFGQDCIAFDKEDGSNIRFEWNPKKGFYKFGTRRMMIDRKTPIYGESIDIFLHKYSDELDKIFREEFKKTLSFVVFCEFKGENSFAGLHDENDKKDVVLFDVDAYKKGIISPYEFVEFFGHLHIPRIIYKGEYTRELVDSVRSNKFDLKEGVVVKGLQKDKKTEKIWSVKVKTDDWLRKVREKIGAEALLEEFDGDKELLNLIHMR